MPFTSKCYTFNLNATLAATLWIAGAILTVGDWGGWLRDDAGFVGILCAAGGHILCMCAMFARQADREHSAFELGRETVVPFR